MGLARVAYFQRAGIVCLDDPLASVDAKVCSDIFKNCIQGFLADRLRLIVTNQYQLLPSMDAIAVVVKVNE